MCFYYFIYIYISSICIYSVKFYCFSCIYFYKIISV